MNRRILIASLAGASLMTAVPAFAQTAPTADDRAAVQHWLDECAAAWATSDAERMYATATDDLEWINIVGMHWRGKAQVIAVHHVYLTTMFRGVPMSLKSIESLRTVGPDVVVAVVRWSVGQFNPPDGSTIPAADDRMTLVFRRTPEGLRLAHGANVQINPVAEQFDPSRGPPPGA